MPFLSVALITMLFGVLPTKLTRFPLLSIIPPISELPVTGLVVLKLKVLPSLSCVVLLLIALSGTDIAKAFRIFEPLLTLSKCKPPL